MSIKIPIISDFDGRGIQKAIAEFKQLETTSQKAQFAVKKAAVPATAALAGLATMSIKAAQAAGDLNEAQNAANVLFGESAKDISSFSKQAAKSLGLSEIAAIQAATAFAGLGKAAGLQGRDLANFSKQFTTLAADMASFMNTSPEDAIQAIGAAMRGEAEPIRRYNVLLDDATLRNRALKLGLISSTKEALTPANKALAAQAEILEQTAYMQGDFAKTSQGAAGQQKILKAQLDNATRSFGQMFIPVLETVLPLLSSLASFASQNAVLFGAVTIAIGLFAGGIVAANIALGVWKTIAAITTAVNTALAVSFTAVQVATGIGIATAIAAAGALVVLSGKIKNAIGDVSKFTNATGAMTDAQGAAYYGLTELEYRLGKFVGPLGPAQQKIREYAAGVIAAKDANMGFASGMGAGESAADKLARKIKNLRGEIGDRLGNALDAANEQLTKAKNKFNDFAQSVSDSITGAFSFKDAKDAATETGQTFLQALTDQVTKTQDFTVKINRLLAAGLSEGALQQVLAAGQDAGGAIADELLAGGADAIGQANALTAKVQSLGASVGQNAATQFYQGGVDAGNALVAGISAVVAKYQLRLSSKGLTEKQLKRLQRNLGVDVDFVLSGGIPALADGGIVTGPTLALIGEAGPEAVVPLDRMGGMGGGDVNIYVQGADPNAVVDALRTYMFRNGSVPIRVS